MFEKFSFSPSQIAKYRRAALRDLEIAKDSSVPEVAFRFGYDALLKLAIAVCAGNGLRAKSRQGHHAELLNKLAFYLKDSDIEIIGNEMRSKRNFDLYAGGILISEKEAKEYIGWIKQIFGEANKYFERK